MEKRPLYDKLNAYLAKHRLKSTKQRDIIVDTFFNREGEHITIEELLEIVRKRNPRISFATVYRTLRLLVEAGVANQRHFDSFQSRFEINSAHHHDHLICTCCGRIVEFGNDTIEDLQEKIAARHQFRLTGHKMELYGLCGHCQNKP